MSSSEGLHKGYDRLQTLLSQLEIHGASVSHEDANQKFLRSLPSSWSQVALIMKTEPGLDTLSFDDLYNNLRVFKHDVKGSTASSSSNTQNVAFVSIDNTSSTNDVSTAYSVSFLSVSKSQNKGSASYTDEEMDLKWQVDMISMRIKKFYMRTGRKLQVKWNQDSKRLYEGYNGNKARDNGRRPAYQDDSKALVTIDGEDIDWSGHVKEDTQNFAMMAYSSSNLGSDNEKLLRKSSFPMTGNYMPSGPDVEIDYSKFTYGPKQTSVDESDAKTCENASSESDSSVETTTSMPDPVDNTPKVVSEPKVWTDAPIIQEYESDSDDDSVSNIQENIEKPSFAFTGYVKHIKFPKEIVKETCTLNHYPKIKKQDRHSHTRKGLGYARKSGFVCGSFSHLTRDCDFHEKRMAKQAALPKSKEKGTSQQAQDHYGTMFKEQATLTSIASKVNTARPFMNETRTTRCFYKSHSPYTRLVHNKKAQRNTFANHKVTTVNTSLSVVKGNGATAVKALAYCNWRKKEILGTQSSNTTVDQRLEKHDPHKALKDKGIVDSGCSRHMTWNKAHLANYQEFKGGSIALEKEKQHKASWFLVGYSLNSKAFRVYNVETKRVKENLHVNFLENKPNVVGKGHAWMFDLDYLTNSMNYEPVLLENQANKSAGLKEANRSACTQATDDQVHIKRKLIFMMNILYCLYGLLTQLMSRAQGTRLKRMRSHVLVSAVGPSRALNDDKPLYPDDPSMPHIEDIFASLSEGIFTNLSYDDEGVVIDFNNLETTTRSKVHKNSKAHALFSIQKVWVLVDLPFGKKAIGTKWVYMNKKDERGAVVRNKARLVAQGHRQEERIDYDEVFALVARIEAIRIFLVFTSYMGFIVYQIDVKSAFLYGTIDEEVYVIPPPGFVDLKFPNKKEDGIFISQDKYVAKILKKFDFLSVKTSSTPIETQKPLVKDKEAANVDVYLYRFMISSLMYLTASRYLKGQPKLGLWYLKVSLFNLEAYSDSDYAGANLDKKSITGGCQFLGRRLISWQCKKQSIMATSTTEAEYVVAVEKFSALLKGRLLEVTTAKQKLLLPSIELASPKQTALGKDESNPLIVDSLLKTIWSSMHHVIAMKHCYSRENGCCSVRYALTASPTIRTSCIKQFWSTAKVKKVNDEVRVQALINANRVTIKESSIRRTLKLDDEEGISCLVNDDIFTGLANMGYEKMSDKLTFYKAFFSPQWKFLIHTILQCLSAKTTSWNEFSSTMTSTIICLTTNQKFNFSRYILLSLVKNIEAGVPFYMFLSICQYKEGWYWFFGVITPLFENMLVPAAEEVGQAQDDVSIPTEPSTFKPHKKHKSKKLQPKASKVPSPAPSPEHTIPSPSNDPILDADKDKSEVIDIKSSFTNRIQKLKDRVDQLEEENRALKENSFKTTQVDTAAPVENIEKSFKQGRMIADMDKDVEEIAKKYRLDEEAEELKRHMQIMANDDDDDDVYTEATPLASKVPVVDYQIHYENNKPYYKIIRADGTHNLFLSFINLLKNFDREDLETLLKLVKERFETTEPKNFSDDFLLNILKIMFEKPNIKASVWKDQKGIYGLAKKYPLTHFTLQQMLDNVRLKVKEESEMSLELLRLVRRQLNEGCVTQ
nr:copia protein [Tanacetum cinerariifolium]